MKSILLVCAVVFVGFFAYNAGDRKSFSKLDTSRVTAESKAFGKKALDETKAIVGFDKAKEAVEDATK